MDLCAEMLLAHLRPTSQDRIQGEAVCPPFRRRFLRLPGLGRRLAFNADRRGARVQQLCLARLFPALTAATRDVRSPDPDA
jgi:hypothetical protein